MHSLPLPVPVGRVLATVTCAVLSAALAWWLVGDLSSTGNAGEQGLDRMAEPPVSEGTAQVLGAGSAVLLPLVLLLGWRLRAVLLPAIVLGAAVGAAGRVVTAGVIGANIGGGMVLLLSPLVLLPLAIWLVVGWRRVQDPPADVG
jgi:hypothetical protein